MEFRTLRDVVTILLCTDDHGFTMASVWGHGGPGSTRLRSRRRRVGVTNRRWVVILIGTMLAVRIMRRHGWGVVALGHLCTTKMGIVWAVVVAALGQTTGWCSRRAVWFWRAHDDAVVGMGLDMFLQILRSLERLAAEFTLVGLQRDVDSDVRRDVVALDGRGSALTPCAGQVQVVGRFATDVSLADVLLSIMLAQGQW